jgi:hypothetical protein
MPTTTLRPPRLARRGARSTTVRSSGKRSPRGGAAAITASLADDEGWVNDDANVDAAALRVRADRRDLATRLVSEATRSRWTTFAPNASSWTCASAPSSMMAAFLDSVG